MAVPSMHMMRARKLVPMKLVNATLFNISWLLIVLSESPIIAPLVALAHLGLHAALVGFSIREARLIAAVTLLGLSVDLALFGAGVFTVNGEAALPPVWMSCLWPVLATTLCHAFSVLRERLVVAAVFGAVGGGLSYTAGTSLTAVAFFAEPWGAVLLGVLWAALFPSLVMLAARMVPDEQATLHG